MLTKTNEKSPTENLDVFVDIMRIWRTLQVYTEIDCKHYSDDDIKRVCKRCVNGGARDRRINLTDHRKTERSHVVEVCTEHHGITSVTCHIVDDHVTLKRTRDVQLASTSRS